MKQKIYISGPITGYDLSERIETFAKTAEAIKSKGHTPVNPINNGLPNNAGYDAHMRQDLKMLLDCDKMVLLDGWGKSVGCSVEVNVAAHTGIKVVKLEEL